MKRYPIILAALISLSTQLCFGQLNHILELSYSPEYITVNDPIIINYTYGYSSQPCVKDSVIVTTKNDTCFQLDIYYNVGDAASPCSDNDSIILNSLTPNTYVILFNLLSTGNITADSDTIIIDIHENEVANENLIMDSFRMYPNPTQDQINISGLVSGLNISIYNNKGQKMKSMKVIGNEHTIDVSNLIEGIYFLKMRYNGPCVGVVRDL